MTIFMIVYDGGMIQPIGELDNPLFRNIYRNVVSKLSEAQDITVHLTPLLLPLKVILCQCLLSRKGLEYFIAGTESC